MHAHAQLAITQTFIEAGQDRIAGGVHNGAVKQAVTLNEGDGIAHELFLLADELIQFTRQHLAKSRSLPYAPFFDEPARLHHGLDVGFADGRDIGAFLGHNLQEAIGLEAQHRFPDRRARCSCRPAYFRFGEEHAVDGRLRHRIGERSHRALVRLRRGLRIPQQRNGLAGLVD